MSNFTVLVAASSVAVFLLSGGYTLIPKEYYDPTCNIKGNISYNGGERIYHMPGQERYQDTRINQADGERWFCSEADARAAGWRRAGR
ncbi:MAG: hypothetical protein DI589_25660 [Shinella sp.]|jgi:hypothetical protein|nr:MAG: hypothetical protein DI589_25660 [Shinella sp.]